MNLQETSTRSRENLLTPEFTKQSEGKKEKKSDRKVKADVNSQPPAPALTFDLYLSFPVTYV